jgi:hypothetical protein
MSVRTDAGWPLPPASSYDATTASNHAIEVVQEEAHHGRLGRGQGHPAGPHPQQTVAVEEGVALRRIGGPLPQHIATGPQIHRVGRIPHPVLERIEELRRMDTGADHQHPRQAEPRVLLTERLFRRPSEDGHVGIEVRRERVALKHEVDGTPAVLRRGVAVVAGAQRQPDLFLSLV